MTVDLLAMFVQAMREPAAVLDHNGFIIAANSRWSCTNTDQALAGGHFNVGSDYLMRCREVRGAPPIEDVVRGVHEVLNGEAEVFTTEYASGGASTASYFELVVTQLANDTTRGALLVHHDITERKRTEAACREAQDRLRHVLEVLPEGYWEWNLETGYVHYSERWCELFGYNLGDIEPNEKAWTSVIHPDDLPRVTEVLYAYLEGRSDVYRCEYRVRLKTGEYRWSLDRGSIVERDANGKPRRLVGLDIDISELKKAQLTIAEQAKRLMDLSTPLIPISDRVVVMPLIGMVDAPRADQVLSTLLHGLSRSQARVVILDITGVSVIDAEVAAALVRAAKAVELLGAQVVLTGVRPEVASILVGLEIQWGNIVMRGTLQSDIAYATRA